MSPSTYTQTPEGISKNTEMINVLIDAYTNIYGLYHTAPGGPILPIVIHFITTAHGLVTATYPYINRTIVPNPHTTFATWISSLATLVGPRSNFDRTDGGDRVIEIIHSEGYQQVTTFVDYLYSIGWVD